MRIQISQNFLGDTIRVMPKGHILTDIFGTLSSKYYFCEPSVIYSCNISSISSLEHGDPS